MEENGITFTLTSKQMEKFKDWKKDKKFKATALSEYYTICFTPTGLGDIVVVKCVDGTEINLTDYDTW